MNRRCRSRAENDEGPPPERGSLSFEIRRRPTLPGGLPPSTIGAGGLNCRVRDGNGRDTAAMATGNRLSRGSEGPRELQSEHERLVNPSLRPISTGRLNTLPCVHLRPINVVV